MYFVAQDLTSHLRFIAMLSNNYGVFFQEVLYDRCYHIGCIIDFSTTKHDVYNDVIKTICKNSHSINVTKMKKSNICHLI